MEQWDIGGILRDAAKAFRWPPAKVWGLTPFEVVSIFGKQPVEGDKDGQINKLAVLAQHNALRAAKGLRPQVPSWWAKPKVKRNKRERRE